MKNAFLTTLTILASGAMAAPVQDTAKPIDKSNVTATSQGTSPADMAMTQKIRSALVDSKDLSTAAKNVVVVTENGTVTVKGNVPSQVEADKVISTAARFVDRTQLRNQLRVGSAE